MKCSLLLQVTEETCHILQHFGYQFEQRGLVAVKGKGQLMTYYLQGKTGKSTPPTVPVSPSMGVSTMETLNEEDESHDSPTSKSDEKTVSFLIITQTLSSKILLQELFVEFKTW